MSSNPIAVPKKKTMRRKKKKCLINYPQTGYVRYINEHRERIRVKNPDLEHIEITKLVAEEWRNLSDEKRKPFLEAADVDKARYHRERDEFKQNEAKRAKIEKDNEISHKVIAAPDIKTPSLMNGSKELPLTKQRSNDFDIPIFTEEFLEHNKQVELELRNLRKANTDYENQNSVLEKHVENMKKGVDKLEMETSVLRVNNTMLLNYLDKLRSTLANSALQGLAIPSEPRGANLQNIDKYMVDLKNMAESNVHGPLNKAKDIIRKLDLQSISI